jgi:hypothetical protein
MLQEFALQISVPVMRTAIAEFQAFFTSFLLTSFFFEDTVTVFESIWFIFIVILLF